MRTPEIRVATPEDASGIAVIYNQIIRDTTITFAPDEKSEADITAMIGEADAYLVVCDGGEVLGFASFSAFRKGPGYAGVKEHSICLAQSTRGAGLGVQLLDALEAAARAQGVTHMIAGVSGENAAGLAFHARHGYEKVGHLPEIGRKFGRAIDLVLMQKTL